MTKEEHDCNCKHDSKNCDNGCKSDDVSEGNTNCKKESKVIENIAKDQESIMHQNEELKNQYVDIKNTLQRVYAEFQNYKKRTDEDKQRLVELSNEDLLKKILPVVDSLELALSHKKQDDDFSRGIELIHAQLIQVLEDEGVRRILSNGKFDPKLHEVLMTENSQKEEGVILDEIQKGYFLGNKILRHAKVKIAKNAR
jgi:molecular chaperone GrpE